jgi:hypothetical protein
MRCWQTGETASRRNGEWVDRSPALGEAPEVSLVLAKPAARSNDVVQEADSLASRAQR